MTKVDFYILEQPHGEARARFACRLAEKAWQQGHRVYIHTDNAQQSRQLDDLLWTFRDGSFIPHCLDEENSDESVAIHIGHNIEPRHHDQVLINLAAEVPLFFSRFERVAEVVNQDEQVRKLGRERFRFYRDRGYPLSNHTIKAGQG